MRANTECQCRGSGAVQIKPVGIGENLPVTLCPFEIDHQKGRARKNAFSQCNLTRRSPANNPAQRWKGPQDLVEECRNQRRRAVERLLQGQVVGENMERIFEKPFCCAGAGKGEERNLRIFKFSGTAKSAPEKSNQIRSNGFQRVKIAKRHSVTMPDRRNSSRCIRRTVKHRYVHIEHIGRDDCGERPREQRHEIHAGPGHGRCEQVFNQPIDPVRRPATLHRSDQRPDRPMRVPMRSAVLERV